MSRDAERQSQSTEKIQAIVALVAGIVGLALFYVPDVGVVGDVVGIVLGVIYHRHHSKGEYSGIAKAGFVTGIIGLCLSALGFLFEIMTML